MSVFTVNRKQLQVELGLLVSVLARKPTIPVLESVRLEWAANLTLTLTASSLDITMVSAIELPAVLTPEHDTFCLPLRELHRLVSLFESEEVAFSRDSKRVLVQGGKSKHKLPFWEGGEYPEFDQVTNPQTFTVESGLIAALARVIPCAASEDNYPTWQYGVHMEGDGNELSLAATDNGRMGFETIATTTPTFAATVPAVGLKPLLAMPNETITVEVGTNRVAFSLGSRKLITGLMDEKYPTWRMTIPDNPHQSQVNSKQLSSALKRIGVTRDERPNSGVKFTFSAETLAIATNTTRGESVETIDVTSNLNGEAIEVGINPDFLNSYLVGAGELVTWLIKDARTQTMLVEADSNFKCVIMTMRIT